LISLLIHAYHLADLMTLFFVIILVYADGVNPECPLHLFIPEMCQSGTQIARDWKEHSVDGNWM
jgi:hypothetical protein